MITTFPEWVAAKARATDEAFLATTPEVRYNIVANTENLVTAEHLAVILNQPGRYPRTVCVMRDTEFVPQETFTSRAQLEKFLDEHDATISYTAIQRSLAGIKLLCESIEALSGIRAFGTVYQTPAATQGFRVHYDMGSVAVLQLSGSKLWRVRRPVVSSVDEITRRDPHLTAEEAEGPHHLEVTLNAGDALFIPRGWPHFAVATAEEVSLHLSIGLLHQDIDLSQVTTYP